MNYVSLAHFPSNTQVQLCILKQFRDPLPDLPLSRSGPLTIILEPTRKVILWLLARASHAPTTTYPSDFTDRYLAIKTKAAYAVLEGGIFLDLRNF